MNHGSLKQWNQVSHFVNIAENIHAHNEFTNGTVNTDGSEMLEVKEKGKKGKIHFVPTIGRRLIEVTQLTKEEYINVKFMGLKYKITGRNVVIVVKNR